MASPSPPGDRQEALPVATYLLIAAQLVVWLVVRHYLLIDHEWLKLALRPGTLTLYGLVVAPFIHLHPTHLGINLAVLWLFGTNLERAIGSIRFLVLYLGAAWLGSAMHWAVLTSLHLALDFSSRNAAVGSSGAIAGVLGASLVRFPQARVRVPLLGGLTLPSTPFLALWFLYAFGRALWTTVYGFSEGVGHWAHFAGFVFGLGVAQLFRLERVARLEYLEAAAERAFERQDLPVAVRAWSALLAMRPEDVAVRSSLITGRLALGDVAGARRLARDGITALVRAGDRPHCLEAYRQYVAAVPDLNLPGGIRYRIGCWLAEAGESELAVKTLWESVREDGATPAAASALYRAGQVAWERMKSDALAREAWERVLEQFPDSPWSDAARDGLRRLPHAG
jgi:membrane associated rhomboid family serine protease